MWLSCLTRMNFGRLTRTQIYSVLWGVPSSGCPAPLTRQVSEILYSFLQYGQYCSNKTKGKSQHARDVSSVSTSFNAGRLAHTISHQETDEKIETMLTSANMLLKPADN